LKTIEIALEPFKIHEGSDLEKWNVTDLAGSRAVEGYAPYTGVFPRSL